MWVREKGPHVGLGGGIMELFFFLICKKRCRYGVGQGVIITFIIIIITATNTCEHVLPAKHCAKAFYLHCLTEFSHPILASALIPILQMRKLSLG